MAQFNDKMFKVETLVLIGVTAIGGYLMLTTGLQDSKSRSKVSEQTRFQQRNFNSIVKVEPGEEAKQTVKDMVHQCRHSNMQEDFVFDAALRAIDHAEQKDLVMEEKDWEQYQQHGHNVNDTMMRQTKGSSAIHGTLVDAERQVWNAAQNAALNYDKTIQNHVSAHSVATAIAVEAAQKHAKVMNDAAAEAQKARALLKAMDPVDGKGKETEEGDIDRKEYLDSNWANLMDW